MARKEGLRRDAPGIARSASAAIAAENASLTDSNYPVAQALQCQGFDTILVGVEITGGSSPTMTIEALVRDAEAADGLRWKRIISGIAYEGTPSAADTGALDGTAFAELPVYGASSVMLRVKAVANSGSTTAWKILVLPGRARNTRGLNAA